MATLENIKTLVSSHNGFSERETEIWSNFAEKLDETKQNRLYEFLKINSPQLPEDIRHKIKAEGLYDKINKGYIKAQTVLSNKEELNMFLEKVAESYQILQNKAFDEEAAKALNNQIQTEDDALKLLIAVGPEGIEDTEEMLCEECINGTTNYSFEEILDLLYHLVQGKNIILKENYQYMIKVIEIYNQAMSWAQEQQKAKIARANEIFDRLVNGNGQD